MSDSRFRFQTRRLLYALISNIRCPSVVGYKAQIYNTSSFDSKMADVFQGACFKARGHSHSSLRLRGRFEDRLIKRPSNLLTGKLLAKLQTTSLFNLLSLSSCETLYLFATPSGFIDRHARFLHWSAGRFRSVPAANCRCCRLRD